MKVNVEGWRMSFSVSGVGGCLDGSFGGEERRVRVLERE